MESSPNGFKVIMTFANKCLSLIKGKRERKNSGLGIYTGVPALGLDALASTGYGPEAALVVLLPLGIAGLHYFFLISCAVVTTLVILYFSYRQTIAAYPNGGGAYVVASDNFGKRVGLWAAVALLLDYLLNVAVGISAGIGAVVSAIPALQPHTLTLCLIVLLFLTLVNLRGIRESGLILVIPTVLFVGCISITIVMGLIKSWHFGGHPTSIIPSPPLPPATASLSYWLLLCAFANGLTALTGVEAVSNAVPLFKKPKIKNARWTLTAIIVILGLFLLALGYLCPTYHILAMDETKPGYQTVLSQLVSAIFGKNIFYYVAIIGIFIVLTYSAQTSFAGFPRVGRLLAEDYFLPYVYAVRSQQLVFSHGIIVLALLSAALLILFEGITYHLIPLFAVGAFSAFFFSQAGMVVYWTRHKRVRGARFKIIFNALGAVVTAIALAIIVGAKFLEGAWIIVFVAPALVLLLTQIRRHYEKLAREVDHPLTLPRYKLKPPIVIVPVRTCNRIAEKTILFAMRLSNDVTALHIKVDKDEDETHLRRIWEENVVNPAKKAHWTIPHLEIINSPHRQLYEPILRFVNTIKHKKPHRLIAVIIPELVNPTWYEYLLHNIQAAGLRTLLFLKNDQHVVVITTPWNLQDEK